VGKRQNQLQTLLIRLQGVAWFRARLYFSTCLNVYIPALATDEQTNEQTNRKTAPSRKASVLRQWFNNYIYVVVVAADHWLVRRRRAAKLVSCSRVTSSDLILRHTTNHQQRKQYDVSHVGYPAPAMTLLLTSSSAVTERPRNALCLSVVSFSSTERRTQSSIVSCFHYRYRFTAANN